METIEPTTPEELLELLRGIETLAGTLQLMAAHAAASYAATHTTQEIADATTSHE
jgi:hypothetical protein